MREIKFRAWDTERNKFNFMDLRDAIGSDNAYALCGGQGTKWEENQENSCAMNCKCELQQFTGLKDKNGKEIYEGDIVIALESNVIGYIEFFNGRLMWTDGGCHWDIIKYDEVYSRKKCNDSEIIGNIYENKELKDEMS